MDKSSKNSNRKSNNSNSNNSNSNNSNNSSIIIDSDVKNEAGAVRNANSKKIFRNPVLCCQFLQDNVDIPILKNIRPEDIEDVSDQYQAYLGIEFESDSVNRILLPELEQDGEPLPLYIVSLVDHKSNVDYDVAMQLLKYMTCIWDDYARKMEKKKEGCRKRKGFRYPPILPIVYYEGTRKWTADLNLKDRIWKSGGLGKYIPDFTYQVVRIHDYSNEELLARGDEMSLLMMINKVQSAEDFAQLRQVSPEKMDEILENTPGNILTIIKDTMHGLLMKMGVPVAEANEYIELVEECRMGQLFENFEKVDIKVERKNTEEARKRAEAAEKKVEEVEKRIGEEREKREEAEKKAQEAENKAIQSCVSLCREFGGSKGAAVQKLIETYGLSKKKAEAQADKYWGE